MALDFMITLSVENSINKKTNDKYDYCCKLAILKSATLSRICVKEVN